MSLSRHGAPPSLGNAGDPEHLSPWSWLVLPLAVGIVLLVFGQLAPGPYGIWIAAEGWGMLELSHVALPLAGFVTGLGTLALAPLRRNRPLFAWVVLGSLACLTIAGEEASWGQHYLGWATPEAWRAINDQGETNLHNVSSWLDQKPRLLLELGVIVGGIGVPLAALARASIRQSRYAIILPPLVCLPSALLAEASRLAERLLDLARPGAYFFYRASEVQELYFYLFLLFYLIVLRRRLAVLGEEP